MDENKFLAVMEELLEVDEGSLNCATSLESTEKWDSLAFVSFLAVADSNYGVNVAPKDLQQCKTIRDLMRLVTK